MSRPANAWPAATLEALKRLGDVRDELKALYVCRDELIDLLVLASVCREHLLVLGPFGTAKTQIIARYCQLLEARHFACLLTRFTEPSEVFGPMDVAEFRRGRYRIQTDRMLPEAEIAFLDEIFQGSVPMLSSLLSLLNERVFYNGPDRQVVPLVSLIGASAAMPEDPALLALADRFLLRHQVREVPADRLADLIEAGWRLEEDALRGAQFARSVRPGDLATLQAQVAGVRVSDVQAAYVGLIRDLRAEGVSLSDRRVVRGRKLIAAAALLRKAPVAAPEDFWPVLSIWSHPEDEPTVRRIVRAQMPEAVGPGSDGPRPADAIGEALALLEKRESTIGSGAAWERHLEDLNGLRRELRRDHPGEAALRARVDRAIERVLSTSEEFHV